MQLRTLAAFGLAGAMAAGLGGTALAKTRPHKAVHRASHKVVHKAVKKATPSPFLKVEPGKKTVVFTVLAGDGTTNGGLDFDNTANGQLTLTVPVKWTVDVVFKNVGGLPHSVLFERASESLDAANPAPAFKGASSPDPVSGTPPGSGANFHFVAGTVGKYRMICAFPGHAALGMWDNFIVAKGAKTATLTVKH
jgi:uncharacterized cupredoxin-like copper-binding protein